MVVGISILVSFLLVLVIGYLCMADTALDNASHQLLDHEAEEGDRGARLAAELQSDNGEHVAAIRASVMLAGFLASAVLSIGLYEPICEWVGSLGIGWLSAITSVLVPILIMLVITCVGVVAGDLVPRRIALSKPEAKAKSTAPVVVALQRVMGPLVRLTGAIANGIARLLRIEGADEAQVSEEEIKHMVSEQEDLSDDEKRMIHDVFELGDAIARESMVPRVDVEAVEDTERIVDVIALMTETGCTRLPVYHEDIDQVIGIVNIKDLVGPALEGHGGEAVVGHVRNALFVPETKDLIPLLSEMKAKRLQMAIVVDEYGGTAGIITIEDIVEEIVGDIADEYDDDERQVICVSEREWVAEGLYPVDEANELGWPVQPSDEYETIAGWIMYETGSLPTAGTALTSQGWTFKVLSMDGRRIDRVRVTAPEPVAEPEEEPAEDGEGLLQRIVSVTRGTE